VPPNPLSRVPEVEPLACDWAGWESDEDEELGGLGAGGAEEDDEPGPPDAGGLDPPPDAGGLDPPAHRAGRVGPGGRRCIVAATCSSGAYLRFSGSNMLERSYSPLQW
jgi:hypothetical protein